MQAQKCMQPKVRNDLGSWELRSALLLNTAAKRLDALCGLSRWVKLCLTARSLVQALPLPQPKFPIDVDGHIFCPSPVQALPLLQQKFPIERARMRLRLTVPIDFRDELQLQLGKHQAQVRCWDLVQSVTGVCRLAVNLRAW